LASHADMLDRLVQKARVNGSGYSIRKATATYLRREGVPELDIKGMLGHSMSGETELYAHYDPQFMAPPKTAVEKLLRAINPEWASAVLGRFASAI